MSPKKVLVIVDDEKRVLDVLSRTFEESYEVRAFGDGQRALAHLHAEQAPVIMTDQRMPGMTGLEFLKQAAAVLPHSVNILLTAYTDLDVVIGAINSGLVYRYLVKPWDTDELEVTVKQAFEKSELIQNNRTMAAELKKKNDELQKNLNLLKETQSKLLLSQKLSIVGQLTASIGHELRNPLSRIKTAASLLKNEIEDRGEEASELTSIIENEITISDKIINDLLDFSKDREPLPEKTNCNEIIEKAIGRIRFPENVSLQLELNPNLPRLCVDPGQLQQILTNLALNASQAMPAGGTVTVRSAYDGNAVHLTIADTGIGISSEHLDRIFEPLFTTKPKGIGLGMSIVRMLVEKNGGRIGIQSLVGKGTTVLLTFPVSQ